jgi:hypothetical protein
MEIRDFRLYMKRLVGEFEFEFEFESRNLIKQLSISFKYNY